MSATSVPAATLPRTRPADARQLQQLAKRIRGHVLAMAERIGQGYVGQGLGIADCLAVIYGQRLRYDAKDPKAPGRDRFVLSIGHYSIGLYAALAEAGILSVAELGTYGADGSRLEMSGGDSTPGLEITGGSLGHGLGQSIGMALGLRLQGSDAWVYNLLSDGEMQEGSTWEAAMAGSHHRLERLVALVDCNNQQADGPPSAVMSVEPAHERWAAFGWHTQRVDGNDIPALLAAFAAIDRTPGRPHAIILDTLMGKGVPLFEQREKNHFIRVEAGEWATARRQLEEGT
jgi:transketolase